MSTLLCPHCKVVNPATSKFCEACGKALPSTIHNSPRVVTGEGMPTSKAAARLMGDDLSKQMKRAANTLLGLGILLTIIGGVLAVVMMNVRNMPMELKALSLANGVLGVIYVGLYFWARQSPLAATLVGLVLYGTLQLLNLVFWFQQASDGDTPRGSPVGCIQIIVFVLLLQGVQAGVKFKQLQKAGHV